jgi:HD-like signal output (HDOD) protein
MPFPAILAIVVFAGVLAAGAWLLLRRPHSASAPGTAQGAASGAAPAPQNEPAAIGPEEAAAPHIPVDIVRVEAANGLAAERLWKLAFAAPSQAIASEVVLGRVRDNIIAVLQVDALDPKHFPRRPALLPQLLQAVNDPTAASERLSRIIAHDPVLTADVLRLANSSLYRTSPTPIETIQRAIVVCGVDALRGMLAAAMLQPVFRATRRNFPRLPRMLWERTERASRAAEIYALETTPEDRFEAQLVVLLSALGPLVVYSAALDVYSRNPHFSPSGDLCVELIHAWAPQMSLRIARDWHTSPRLLDALDKSSGTALSAARHVGEFLGTLSLLESQAVISREERLHFLEDAGIPAKLANHVWLGLTGAV